MTDDAADAANAERWREGAEHWAATADARYPVRARFWDLFTRSLTEAFDRPIRVLELGSGPGFLAERILAANAVSRYALVDVSEPMHALARDRLAAYADKTEFVIANYGAPDWSQGLGVFDAVVSIQAIHEVRHKDKVPRLYASLRPHLAPDAIALICDRCLSVEHPGDDTLHQTQAEHERALASGGFTDIRILLAAEELAMFRAS